MPYESAFFDRIIDRRGTNCQKWDGMAERCGVSPEDGIAMWVADMDFRPPASVPAALQRMIDHGVFGYAAGDAGMREAVARWMAERHGWQVDPAHIFSTDGLVNAVALCLDVWSSPGDSVVVFSPVYHAFGRVVRAAGRELVECELALEDGRYTLDFERYDAQMTGRERILLLCSPHNPGGRVWSRAELEGVAAFARRHDLLIVSDEIHHDLVLPGSPRHTPTALIDGVEDRLVTLTAPTKTFNLAGAHIGQVTIADPRLRTAFAERLASLALYPGAIPPVIAEAAYSDEGAEWLSGLLPYLDANRALVDEAVAAIPGLASMPLEATYLAWIDFAGTGMAADEFTARVEKGARIGVNRGTTFGTGGETFLRFNLATPRARVAEAMERLRTAFADLQ
ncbi:putative C-S lyase [Rhodovulum sp. 12E13]|uniref:MalY/PatB family protein n=1 Tax=Rhodovulum sp. 12E13 TaxID=2203891 RepID=UPI000E195A0D|nr:PatB family C-S lyase [Rhodovulum sp. 12E13]RDC74939.1 putative C-S lyase [Rhodovulum sp. 12E13]